MRELITVEAFDRGLVMGAVVWAILCLLWGVTGRLRGRPTALVTGGAGILLGGIILGLWRFYSWMVRVDPATGEAGLHRVSVFALCLLVFVVVGALVGALLPVLYRREDAGGPGQGPPEPNEERQ